MINQRPKGFTLIEMIIVFALIGILVGLGLPQYTNATKRAREAVLKEDLFLLRKLLGQYHLDKGQFPASLQTLVDDGYLYKIPVDPITKTADSWIEVMEVLNEEDLVAGVQPGISDIKSGSNETALDGTLYSTW
jgi:general secretion pathway protein G